MLEARRGRPDRVAQIGDHFRLARSQCLVRMGGVDQLRVRPLNHLHFLQALADDLDLRDDVLDFASAMIEIPQLR